MYEVGTTPHEFAINPADFSHNFQTIYFFSRTQRVAERARRRHPRCTHGFAMPTFNMARSKWHILLREIIKKTAMVNAVCEIIISSNLKYVCSILLYLYGHGIIFISNFLNFFLEISKETSNPNES